MGTGLPPRIGPYEPLELLAEGGMARVVVARQAGIEGFERLVALKLIRPELASEQAYVTMFLDEARINSRVHHPNVVEILDVGRDERTDILYIAMGLVLGATLAEVMRNASGPVPTPVALEIVAQAAEGLQAAHTACAPDGTHLAMVHRDVSPQNLLIGLDGVVRVSDFGVARAAQRATRTKTGQFKGKLAYCSPEQAMGLPLDHRSDVFALGVVAWELLAGARLFGGKPTPYETLDAILHRVIPRFSEVRPDLSPRAAAMLDRALEREPAKRPGSAGEVAEALRESTVKISLDSPPDLREAVRAAASPLALRLAGLDAGEPRAPRARASEAVTKVGKRMAADEETRVDGPDESTAVAAWWQKKIE